MSRNKPLMTPEQQIMFRKAVAQGVLDPVPYDEYCAITPEQADAKFKELKGKVDFGQPLPEKDKSKDAPLRKFHPNAPATQAQCNAITKGVEDGILDGYPPNWGYLTVGKASEYVKQIHAQRPPEPATESQMKEIDRLVADGRIYPMKSETYHSLTKSAASERIAIGRNNEKQGITVDGYDPNYVPKRNQLMDKDQAAEIDRLVADKRLNPLSDRQRVEYTQEQAGRLIFLGKKREEENTIASEFERSRSQEPEAPEPEKKEPEKPKRSRKKAPTNDIPM